MTEAIKSIFRFQHQPRWIVIGWLSLCLISLPVPAKDWPQWGGTDGKNMVSEEKGLPDSFVPGEKDTAAGRIKLETAQNVQ